MKKAISFTIMFFVVLLIYQVGINYIKKEHSVQYDFESSGITYYVNEEYSYDNNDSYTLRIKDSNNNAFLFNVKNNFNKQREVVKNVVTYTKDDLYCISLVLLNDKSTVEPLCKIGDIVYSYSYIMGKYDISEFLDSLKNIDYKKYNEKSDVRNDSGINVNKDYLEERELIMIYDYKRIVFHNSYNADYFVFTTSDNYKNSVGIRVDNYYVIPKLTESATINNFLKYNLDDSLKSEVPSAKISKQFYINGVYDHKLYIFDKSEMAQYSFDPDENEFKLVSDGNEGIIYENGKEKKVSVYDMAQEVMVFTPDASDYSKIEYEKIYLGDDYAVYLKDGGFYKVYKKFLDDPVYLFDKDDIREIIIRDDNIYYIKDDTIYRHNSFGNVPLVQKNEFKYNSDNIYDVYFID